MTGNVRIEAVTDRAGIRDVATFPMALYKGDPNYVPRLIGDYIKHLQPAHNPFFEHAEMQLYRAVRDDKTVGTIAAIRDRLHETTWNEPVGFFGVFECIEDDAVAFALLDAAGTWLAARGLKVMRGPMNLNINDECGMLIAGFDGPAVVMMPYNKLYYPGMLDRYGATKAKDLYAFDVEVYQFGPDVQGLPARLARFADVALNRYNVKVRSIDMKHLADDVALLKPVHREAWAKNWGAVPPTDAEYDYLLAQLKPVIDPALSYLAFIDGEMVGVFLTLPDVNQILPYANGKMWPFGWAKLLLHQKEINRMRVLIMGVKEEHRLKGIEALFYKLGCEAAYARGYRHVEMSWILEDNFNVIRGIERMGGTIYRTYRLYDKALAPTGGTPAAA